MDIPQEFICPSKKLLASIEYNGCIFEDFTAFDGLLNPRYRLLMVLLGHFESVLSIGPTLLRETRKKYLACLQYLYHEIASSVEFRAALHRTHIVIGCQNCIVECQTPSFGGTHVLSDDVPHLAHTHHRVGNDDIVGLVALLTYFNCHLKTVQRVRSKIVENPLEQIEDATTAAPSQPQHQMNDIIIR